jgi:hypothetical protein
MTFIEPPSVAGASQKELTIVYTSELLVALLRVKGKLSVPVWATTTTVSPM